MTVVVKKYGRWSESCNWQLESRVEKECSKELLDSMEFLGYYYNERYNEYYLISEDKQKRTVVKVK